MIQIEYEKHWLHFLDTYVRPLQEKVFMGYDFQVRLLTFLPNTSILELPDIDIMLRR